MNVPWPAKKDEEFTDSIDDGFSCSNEIEYARSRGSHSRDAPAHLLRFHGVDEYIRNTLQLARNNKALCISFTEDCDILRPSTHLLQERVYGNTQRK